MDADSIIEFEDGEQSHEETIAMFQSMINSGMAWKLQGSYGRCSGGRSLRMQELRTKGVAMVKSKHGHQVHCAPHLRIALLPEVAKHTVARICKLVRQRNIEFDAIACRGLSGLLIAPIVAMRLKKTLLCVRKGEKTHSTYPVEGDTKAKTYVILDGFIDTGSTVSAIVGAIKTFNTEARCIGFIAYKQLGGKAPIDECYDRAFLSPAEMQDECEEALAI